MVKLSIVIPYFKTYELTTKLLDKLILQLTDETEVFLIDDGCKEYKLDEYKEINVIHNDEDMGVSYSRNVGIKKSNGKYIAFIDSDDMISDDYVKTLIELINTRDEDIIYFGWQNIKTGNVVLHPSNPAVWKAIYKKDIIPLFKEQFKFNEDVFFQEDIDKLEKTTYFHEKVLYYYNADRVGSLIWYRNNGGLK